MPGRRLRILLVADTHLGLDLPLKPRVERRRRGPDFFRNFERALEPALDGEIDLVVHGGDLLFRSRVKSWLVERALAPLLRVAEAGVPIVLVPGNHERSRIPMSLLTSHRRLHILDKPRTIELELGELKVAVSGFPCVRNGIRNRFSSLLSETGWDANPADLRLLCLHQSVEGARVGPADYTFRHGEDVIRGRDIPPGFAPVLAGHIHRHQVLTADLSGRTLGAPVFYPGAIERTSTAEREERKGYLTLSIRPDDESGGSVDSWTFHELKTRPMVDLALQTGGLDRAQLERLLQERLAEIDQDAIVRIHPEGNLSPTAQPALSAQALRALAPPTMTISLHWRRHA